jgi:CheY-like chemotaxis protein
VAKRNPKKILIADDEPSIRFLLRKTLESGTIEVLEAATGREALATARKGRPDLIILDVVMPDLYGSEVCEKLRKQPKTARIPIMIITADSGRFNAERARECGADYYLAKPFTLQKLNRQVREILFGRPRIAARS